MITSTFAKWPYSVTPVISNHRTRANPGGRVACADLHCADVLRCRVSTRGLTANLRFTNDTNMRMGSTIKYMMLVAAFRCRSGSERREAYDALRRLVTRGFECAGVLIALSSGRGLGV